ncbi:unnamed protein product [Vitrella brassicaformis CCMP3155]|uniref:FAD-binding domain-containing protein n=3 Tax=Vitrella brassicaformis TaxID=1169539 RepID=A0A0G4FFK9_VITBC|nr:unnamed protein product [Vitrella brassicaformis CCMP3155]|eukprot:CEM11958.1 unnamed protein product [Vitrella brassicaformis CCMP3155]
MLSEAALTGAGLSHPPISEADAAKEPFRWVEEVSHYCRDNVDNIPESTEVIIIGMGPCGLCLGAELHLRGIDFIIIDRCPRVIPVSTALAIHVKTLEIFERLGIINEVLERAVEVRGERLFVNGQMAVDFAFDECQTSHHKFPVVIPQDELEHILTKAIGPHRWKAPLWVHSLEASDQRQQPESTLADATAGMGVSVSVQAIELTPEIIQHCAHGTPLPEGSGLVFRGEAKTIRGKYLVGADGAASRVRQEMGIKFGGKTLPYEYVSADAHIRWGIPANLNRWNCLTANGHLVSCIALTNDRWRVTTLRWTGQDEQTTLLDNNRRPQFPSQDELEDLLNLVVPGTKVQQMLFRTVMPVHSRSAERYSAAGGRVFLIGDAAHAFPPLGYLGMNVGVDDASNLGWKLARVCRGRAAPELLDTYDGERRPVGEKVVKYTTMGYNDVLLAYEGKKSKSWGAFMLKHLLPLLFRAPYVSSTLSTAISMTNIQYSPQTSALSDKHRVPSASAMPGWRLPDTMLELINESSVLRCRLHQILPSPHFALVMTLCLPSTPPPMRASFINCACAEDCPCYCCRKRRLNTMGSTILWLVHLAGGVMRKLGHPNHSPWGGVQPVVVLTFPKGSSPSPLRIEVPGQKDESLAALLWDVKARLQQKLSEIVGPLELPVGWDVTGEIRQLLGPGNPLPPCPGAFHLLRPDGVIACNGVAGDFEAASSLLKGIRQYLSTKKATNTTQQGGAPNAPPPPGAPAGTAPMHLQNGHYPQQQDSQTHEETLLRLTRPGSRSFVQSDTQ